MTQWTWIQAQVATLAYPQIGSICSISASGEPVISRLATAPVEELRDAGPFSTSVEYFIAVADAAVGRLSRLYGDFTASFGAVVFLDILRKTSLFGDMDSVERFPLNHIGTQNVIVDDEFNFIAVIDWGFTQTAPWQVNHYPMPFPLLRSKDTDDILGDPSHLARENVLRQDRSRRIYRQKFREAERKLEEEGRPLAGSIADTLDRPVSTIYACFTNLGRLPEADQDLVLEMGNLALPWVQPERTIIPERQCRRGT